MEEGVPAAGDSRDPATAGPAAERYAGAGDRSSLGSRVLAVGLVVLLVATLAAVVLFFLRRQTAPEISGTQTGFTIVDEHTATMWVDVTRGDPATPVFCIVRAKDSAGAEVGRREVYVPPSAERTVRLDTTLATTARASGTDVYGCGADIPAHLRS